MAKIVRNAKVVSVKRGRKPADPNETPANRFKRLAGVRTRRVLQFIKGLENCTTCVRDGAAEKAGMGYYSTPEQWQKIQKAIARSIERLQVAIEQKHPSNGEGFKL